METSKNISKQDLQDLKIELLEAIDDKFGAGNSEQSNSKRWLRTNEVVAYLSISKSQVHNLKEAGVLRCKKLGGTNYYDKNQIDEYLENQEEDLL
jgi:predicted DNA-binding transcriptional regulator AlpA